MLNLSTFISKSFTIPKGDRDELRIRDLYLRVQNSSEQTDDRIRFARLTLEGITKLIYQREKDNLDINQYNKDLKAATPSPKGLITIGREPNLYQMSKLLIHFGEIDKDYEKIMNDVREGGNGEMHFYLGKPIPPEDQAIIIMKKLDPVVKYYFKEKYKIENVDSFRLNPPSFKIWIRRNKKILIATLIIIAVMTMFLLWIMGYPKYKPITQIVSVHVLDEQFNIPEKNIGKISLKYGTAVMDATINENGIAFFPEIPSSYLNTPVDINIDILNYVITDTNVIYKLNGDEISIGIIKNNQLGSLSGFVQDANSLEFIPNAKLFFSDIDLNIYSDKNGRFKIQLPYHFYKEKYKIQVSKNGYLTLDEVYRPNENIEIRLLRNE